MCQREFQWPARQFAAALKQHALACTAPLPAAEGYSTCCSATLKLVKKGSPDACQLKQGLGLGKSQLVLSNGMAIGPKWDATRNAWGQWDYIDLGVGEHRPDSIQVHLNDDGFIVWHGKHGEGLVVCLSSSLSA